MPWKLKEPVTFCSFLGKLQCLKLTVGRKPNLFPGFQSLDECSVCEAKATMYEEVILRRGRPSSSVVTSCTTLSSRGTPH